MQSEKQRKTKPETKQKLRQALLLHSIKLCIFINQTCGDATTNQQPKQDAEPKTAVSTKSYGR
jgi:hypothetical protein